MKIIIAYPPLDPSKGVPLLSQNRQFQYFNEPTYIYPVVPAQAATLLKQAGHEVVWLDGIAEGLIYSKFLDRVKLEKPDLIAIETKTPAVKQHWKIINDLKKLATSHQSLITVLFGDHVTALPEESFKNSQVDFVLTGGDYDFLLLNLCNSLSTSHQPLATKLEPGIWYRENSQIKNTGTFKLNHDLNSLPFIDRDLTQWQLYAYKNGNFKNTPGTYIMSGRDCWWGKCKFCLEPSTLITTDKGTIAIEKIVESENANKDNFNVLTHEGTFLPITRTYKRFYEGSLLNLEFLCLKNKLKLTPNHKIFALKRLSLKRCSKKCSWTYLCVPGRKSKRLDCNHCNKKYYEKYNPSFIESTKLEKDDFVAVPIIRKVKDILFLEIKDFLEKQPLMVSTQKNKPSALIEEIIKEYRAGLSQRAISSKLRIDRETVKRYLFLFKTGQLDVSHKLIIENNGFIKFEHGKKWILRRLSLSADFLRLIGYYLAEGSVCKLKNRPNSYCLNFTFSAAETQYVDDVVAIARKLGDKIDICKHKNKVNHTTQITINSSILAILFSRLFGVNSYEKKIPLDFLYLPLAKQRELLRGLFRGDGHLRIRQKRQGGTEYILTTVSSAMAHQFLNILFRFEAVPRFRLRPIPKKGKVPVYEITLSQYDIERVFPDIKLPAKSTKYRHGFILGNSVMLPIKRIKNEIYKGYVYNLEVEKDHSYVAANVSVSNCSWPTLYPSFRSRTPKNVLDEIEMLVAKFPIKEIMDDSGTFPVGDWLDEFCDGMIKRGLNKKIKMDCNMRFGALTQAQYNKMREAGFRLVLFGLESANQNTLDRIQKNLKVEEIEPSCKMARKEGLYPHITIMFGYPWETYDDALNTLKLGRWLLKKGYAYTVQATMVIPYPGSELFAQCRKNDWLKSVDWNDYDMKSPVMKSEINDKAMHALVQGIYNVAFDPEFIVRRLGSMRSISDLCYFGRGFKKVFGHLMDFKK